MATLPPEALSALAAVFRPLLTSEYLQLADRGAFEGERVELLRGRVVSVVPHDEDSASVVEVLNELLVLTLSKWAKVRPALPLIASEDSMPEPDFALIPRVDGTHPHPTRALLLIEVSKSSLPIDLRVKAPLYAEGGSPEYWIVDIAAAQLHVFRAPKDGAWTEQFTLTARDSIRPVSFPEVEFSLAPVLLATTH